MQKLLGVILLALLIAYAIILGGLRVRTDKAVAQMNRLIKNSRVLIPPEPPVECSLGEYALCLDGNSTWLGGEKVPGEYISVTNCSFEGRPGAWKISDNGAPCMVNGKHYTRPQ